MKLLVSTALLMTALVMPAFAGDQDFTLKNRTGYEIAAVFVSPHSASNWGEDLMGDDTLPDGKVLNVHFPRNASACHWDLKVVYTDKETAEWGNVDLCELSSITIRWDRKSGETTATAD